MLRNKAMYPHHTESIRNVKDHFERDLEYKHCSSADQSPMASRTKTRMWTS